MEKIGHVERRDFFIDINIREMVDLLGMLIVVVRPHL